MNEHPQYQRGGDQAKRTVVIPDRTAREPNDVGLAHGIALLEILEPRQAALALLTLTTGLDGAAAVGMRWRDIDDMSGRAVFYDPGLQVERIVPLPKITFDAIRRLPYDGRDTVFVEDLEDAWPYRLVTEFDDGDAAELTLQTFEHAFLRTAGRLRMLQMVVDQIAPPPFSVRSGQIERYADVIKAVTAHHVPLLHTARRAISKQRLGDEGYLCGRDDRRRG